MENKDLNYWYKKMQLGPSVEVEEEFARALWLYCHKVVKLTFLKQFNQYIDCVNDSVLACLNTQSPYDGKNAASYSTWVSGVVKRTCLHEKCNRIKLKELPLEDVPEESSYVTQDKRLDLQKLISQLSQDEKDLVNLKLQGFENEEVGAHFNISANAAKCKYQRITEKLTLLAQKSH